jgi:hypothetical protein
VKPSSDDDKQKILQQIAQCSPEDFDGHTEFHKLTPYERLLWLSHTVSFVHDVAQHNPDLGCNRLFKS